MMRHRIHIIPKDEGLIQCRNRNVIITFEAVAISSTALLKQTPHCHGIGFLDGGESGAVGRVQRTSRITPPGQEGWPEGPGWLFKFDFRIFRF
jgi:hypothetical protein